ncbi:hypothetical protein H0H81_004419 [Sphagnurus paluster]|uniref:Uncharacterized protein n=1 Tax=Sphagnurus paluster TaxID=117069 RepID=A0A9P7GLA1_9AGAR|nr:hypothetical protein H0H81_004419 [Sphagnurus paluster]
MPPKKRTIADLDLTTFSRNNINEKITIAESLLKQYSKAAKKQKGNLGGDTYKSTLQARLDDAKAFHTRNTTLAGSPNDPQVPGSFSQAGAPSDILCPPPLQPDKAEISKRVVDAMTFAVIRTFTKAWQGKIESLSAGNFVDGPKSIRELAATTTLTESAIFEACQKIGTTPDYVGWPSMADHSGPSSIHEMMEILKWMQANVEDLGISVLVQEEANTSRAQSEILRVFNYETNQWVQMTSTTLKKAHDPQKWIGCVELGLPAVQAVLTNHTRGQKCLSHKYGPRGEILQALWRAQVQEFCGEELVKDCGCPLETAAIELWLSKITCSDLGGEVGTMKPAQLRVVEGGLHAVSGHTAKTLLQPKKERLEYTAKWALAALKAIYSDDVAHTEAVINVMRLLNEVTH